MEFYNVIRTRRSIRSYQDRDIPDEVLERILDAARIAPSGNNQQPWSFVVVKNQEKRKQIAKACYDQGFIAKAPMVIVCCAKQYSNSHELWKDDCYLADTVIAIDHLVLAARNESIGSCWIGAVHDKQVKKIIDAPDDVNVLIVVSLGYPISDSAFSDTLSRKPISDICFLEEYGVNMG